MRAKRTSSPLAEANQLASLHCVLIQRQHTGVDARRQHGPLTCSASDGRTFFTKNQIPLRSVRVKYYYFFSSRTKSPHTARPPPTGSGVRSCQDKRPCDVSATDTVRRKASWGAHGPPNENAVVSRNN